MMALLLIMVMMYMIGFGTCFFMLNKHWKTDMKSLMTDAMQHIMHKIDRI